MKKRKKKVYDDDDGRVISNMNVEGMPYYRDTKPFGNEGEPSDSDLDLSQSERRAMIGGVFAAALLVAGIFALVGTLFLLFCTKVWLKP